uniref:HDC18907 n=1 Tax=Drosophila melanogaster TaxID=7227 RepID=Q6IIC7_DROME|nr:TPA_inf: HDC18907 [Drosophila melanogaster]
MGIFWVLTNGHLFERSANDPIRRQSSPKNIDNFIGEVRGNVFPKRTQLLGRRLQRSGSSISKIADPTPRRNDVAQSLGRENLGKLSLHLNLGLKLKNWQIGIGFISDETNTKLSAQTN